ncbi:MAG: cytochrome c family protein [Alphaproteobacteria bacterium]
MGSDPLFLNKVAAAVIGAGLLAMTAGFVTHFIYHPKVHLEQHAYAIAEGLPAPSAAAGGGEPAALEPIGPMLASADPAAGEAVFKKCVACHTPEEGGANKVGPNLHDVVGRDIASHAGFSYSAALQGKEGSWTYEDLNTFLHKPQSFAKGTKMTFAGLAKAEDRANVIAYLRSLSASPQPLP